MLDTHVLITTPARSGSRLLTEPGFFILRGLLFQKVIPIEWVYTVLRRC